MAKNYVQIIKDIRPFVSFDYDLREVKKFGLSPAQKRELSIYHKEISALKARPHYIFRGKNAAHLKQAQKFAQHEKHLPHLKAAFIPAPPDHNIKIRFTKKGEIVLKSKYVTQKQISFDMKKLIKNPAKHAAEVIKKEPKANSFHINAGRYEIKNPETAKSLPDEVARLANLYGNKKKNSYFGNWMYGLKANIFTRQQTAARYKAAKNKARAAFKANRKKKGKKGK